jgi:5-methylcytosine-specific restriction enzyme A
MMPSPIKRMTALPYAPKHPCNYPMCPELTHSRYCETHVRVTRSESDKRRKGHNKHYNTADWQRKRKRWLSKNPFCQHVMPDGLPCNKPGNTVDHVVPLNDGGADDESNYQTLCQSHHSYKTAKFDRGFGRARAAG